MDQHQARCSPRTATASGGRNGHTAMRATASVRRRPLGAEGDGRAGQARHRDARASVRRAATRPASAARSISSASSRRSDADEGAGSPARSRSVRASGGGFRPGGEAAHRGQVAAAGRPRRARARKRTSRSAPTRTPRATTSTCSSRWSADSEFGVNGKIGVRAISSDAQLTEMRL